MPGTEDALRSERERLRHVTELAEAATDATEALSSEQSETGAVDQLAKAANTLMPVTNPRPRPRTTTSGTERSGSKR